MEAERLIIFHWIFPRGSFWFTSRTIFKKEKEKSREGFEKRFWIKCFLDSTFCVVPIDSTIIEFPAKTEWTVAKKRKKMINILEIIELVWAEIENEFNNNVNESKRCKKEKKSDNSVYAGVFCFFKRLIFSKRFCILDTRPNNHTNSKQCPKSNRTFSNIFYFLLDITRCSWYITCSTHGNPTRRRIRTSSKELCGTRTRGGNITISTHLKWRDNNSYKNDDTEKDFEKHRIRKEELKLEL